MTLIGPYRLLRSLGRCEVGGVWSAFDADGNSVTVAVIDEHHAANRSWLDGFRSGVEALTRSGELTVVGADLSASTPWVACAWDGDVGAARLFIAQGFTYVPASAPVMVAPPARAATGVRAASGILQAPPPPIAPPIAPAAPAPPPAMPRVPAAVPLPPPSVTLVRGRVSRRQRLRRTIWAVVVALVLGTAAGVALALLLI